MKLARWIHAGLALGLATAAPMALAQKMYKCPDGAGGTTFQQQPCPETAKEAEARQKEKELREAEAARKKEDEAKKKAEAIQKAKERDQAYQEAEKQRAEARRKAAEAEKAIMQGTGAGSRGPTTPVAGGAAAATPSDGSLSEEMEALYPAPWKKDANAAIVGALAKKQVAGCGRFEYRQRVKNGADILVHCLTGAGNYYFVWPATENVRGPVKF